MYKQFLFLLCSFVPFYSVLAETFDMDIEGENKSFAEDVFVAENIPVVFENVFITDTLSVENHGVFSVNSMDVCARCDLFFENFNTININSVDLNDDSRIFQIVSDVNNMNPINIGAEYTVLVGGNNDFSLSDIVDVVSGSGNIVLENTTLHINSVPLNTSKNIEIKENVKFIISDIADLYNVTLLDNITGGATARFISNNDDVMYVMVGEIADGKLFIKHIRETDYNVIFNNDMGVFLNSLRMDNKNNKLMDALDSATDKNSLYSVMSKSVLFNPDVLVKPLQIINKINMMSIDNGFTNSVDVNVFGVMSDDFYTYGSDIGVASVMQNKFKLSLGAQIANIEYSSGFNEFSGVVYGLNLQAAYLFSNKMFLHIDSGLSFAQFDITNVMYNDKMISKPNSLFGYVVLDTGYELNFDSFSVVPVAGIGMQFYDLNGIKYSDFVGRVGGAVEYKYAVSDLEYVYGVSVIADSHSAMSLSGKVGFMSPTDMIGGYVELSTILVEDSVSYKASVNAKILF